MADLAEIILGPRFGVGMQGNRHPMMKFNASTSAHSAAIYQFRHHDGNAFDRYVLSLQVVKHALPWEVGSGVIRPLLVTPGANPDEIFGSVYKNLNL